LKIWFNTLKIISFIGSGFIGGLLSLFLLSIIDPLLTSLTVSEHQIVNVLVEESVKLFLLYRLYRFFTHSSIKPNTHRQPTVYLQNALLGITFGLGFSLFELFLLTLNSSRILNLSFVLNTFLHSTTALLLSLGITISISKKKLSTIIPFWLLAFFLHLCYNLIVMNRY